MRKLMILILVLACFFGSKAYASMSEYCATPPFLSRTVAPNVMIVLDNSGSMFNFAYDYNGSGVSSGFNPNSEYYGYFDSNFWYKYESGKFVPTASKSSRNKYSNEWDGNFLNWLTMRRVDIARKVLVGGKYSDGCLIGEEADGTYRGCVKEVNNAENYTPYSGIRYFNFYAGGSGTSRFCVCDSCSWSSWHYICSGCSDYYNVKVKVDEQPEGIIQKVGDKVRWGLTFYNYSEGGYISNPIGYNNINSIVNHVRTESPSTWTPLAETLWTVTGYFAQKASASEMPGVSGGSGPRYHNGDYQINNNVDPYNYGTGGSPIWAWCAKSFIIYITDGESTMDESIPSDLQDYDSDGNDPGSYSSNGTDYFDDVALYAHTTDLRNDLKGTQTLTIYSVFAFGGGSELLKDAAINGGFVDKNGNNKPDLQSEWDEDGDGVPDNYFEAENGAELEAALEKILTDILRQVSSGTSVSVLAEKTKKGSLMLQAVFYPERQFGSGSNVKKVDWIGYLYTWWFYNSSIVRNIREDTIENKALDICQPDGSEGGDYILDFLLDNNLLKINASKSKKNGTKGSLAQTYSSLDETHPVWEGGEKLKNENPTERTIYTVTGNLQPSIPTDLTELKDLNNTGTVKYSLLFGDEDEDGSIDEDDETTKLISQSISFADLKNFIYGKELTGYRNRKVDTTHTWKLGDIIYSTPSLVEYDDYAVVYIGANDGMLHAFRLGKQRYDGLGPYQDVKLCEDKDIPCNTSKLGEEIWAFIPKNALPYLRALTDPNYCHLYYVDLTPYIVQLDTNNDGKVDKRVLIGGMRFGGAVGCSGSSCINPPADTCPNPSNYNPSTNTCIGLSSYFALDITDPDKPKFLWEFTDKDLGFTYSGPAFIKRNGNYYVMFISGPTNYQGESDQDLTIFVLKLKNNFTISTIYKIDSSSQSVLSRFNNAFGGRLFTNGVDYDNDGNTDAIFLGVTHRSGATWHGNVLMVKITDDDPQKWTYECIFNTGEPSAAITSKIEHGKCFDMYYIYFGTGRYFYKEDDPGSNSNDIEYLYGVRIDPCLDGTIQNCNIDAAHNSQETCNELQQGSPKVTAWKQELDPKQGDYFKERMISDPTITEFNAVFFTTTEPTADICGYGGRSRIWGLNCATGESLLDQHCDGYITDTINGTLFLQLSRGNIEQINVNIIPSNPGGSSNPFTEKNNKATPWMTGVPPESSTPFIPPPGSKKGEILYWIEK